MLKTGVMLLMIDRKSMLNNCYVFLPGWRLYIYSLSLFLLYGWLNNANAATYLLEKSDIARTFSIYEFSVRFKQAFAGNPFDITVLAASVEAPDKSVRELNGFCDDNQGRIFKLRYTPVVPGIHKYTLQIKYNDQIFIERGEFLVTESGRSGFVHVDVENPNRLRLHNGQRPLFISKTAWLLLGSSTWKEFIDQAYDNGINVLRFGLEVNYYHSSAGIDVWPWQGTRAEPDYEGFNVSTWQHFDEVFHYALEKGMYLEPVIFTSIRRNTSSYVRLFLPDPHMKRYWRYLMARINAYPNLVFIQLFNEFGYNKAYQRFMAEYLQKYNSFDQLITTSAGTTMDAIWPKEKWNDLAVNHTCTSSNPQRHGLWTHYFQITQNITRYQKPAWIDESGRARHKNTDPIHRRKQYWIWSMAGVYWNYHSRGGCEDIEKLTLGPGEKYIPFIRKFWQEHTTWADKKLNNRLLISHKGSEFALATSNAATSQVIVYLFNEASGQESRLTELLMNLPEGKYTASLYDPHTGQVLRELLQPVSVGEQQYKLQIPAFTDDRVVSIVKVR